MICVSCYTLAPPGEQTCPDCGSWFFFPQRAEHSASVRLGVRLKTLIGKNIDVVFKHGGHAAFETGVLSWEGQGQWALTTSGGGSIRAMHIYFHADEVGRIRYEERRSET